MLENFKVDCRDWFSSQSESCCGIQELGDLDKIYIDNIETYETLPIDDFKTDSISQIELIRKSIRNQINKHEYNATIVYIPNNEYWNSWRIAFELENFHEAFSFASTHDTYNITAFVKIHKTNLE